MGWGGGGGWSSSKAKSKGSWKDTRNQEQDARDTQANGGMGPYGRPAERGMPPEPPLWHGHAWQPEGVIYDPASGQFSDGYVPGPGDKPQF